MTQDAKDFLRQIEGPVGLVAVAGMYRTGKSYLLNRMLLNRSNGFGVGPTINPCTKVRVIIKKGFENNSYQYRDSGSGANPFRDSHPTASQLTC